MKKLLALVLALVMSMSLVTISNAAYSDAADIDYTEAVDVMSAIGVLQGSDGKFNPDGILTRAEACTIITKILGMADYVGTSSFADVKGHWGESAISFCAGEGIVNGTSATTFDPNGICTRAQIVTFLWRANGSPAVSGNSAFTDVAADAYYAAAVTWAEKNGVTGGIGGGLFGSGNNCTRAQIVTFIWRCKK